MRVRARRGSRRTARRVAALAATAAATLGACSDSNDTTPDSTAVSDTTSTTIAISEGDGQLVIGLMRPTANSRFRESVDNGVSDAVNAINADGGLFGRSVRLIQVDEGTTTSSAAAAIDELLDEGVDAIVGPHGSNIALGVLERITSAGAMACSPTATSLALDDFPDDDRFFRTVPSDSMQAIAIAEQAEETGARSVTVVNVDDVYGRPFADAVVSELDLRDVDVAARQTFLGHTEDFGPIAAEVADSDASVLIVIGNAEDTARLLLAVDDIASRKFSTIIVNDALRNAGAAQEIRELSPSLRRNLLGVAPQAAAGPEAPEPFDPPGPFATNAFDCVNLIALAALQAGSDAPDAIASEIASVSSSGSVCTSFALCRERLESGLEIDYNGPAGLTEIRVRGEPARARFDRFGFDDNGVDEWNDSFVIES